MMKSPQWRPFPPLITASQDGWAAWLRGCSTESRVPNLSNLRGSICEGSHANSAKPKF